MYIIYIYILTWSIDILIYWNAYFHNEVLLTSPWVAGPPFMCAIHILTYCSFQCCFWLRHSESTWWFYFCSHASLRQMTCPPRTQYTICNFLRHVWSLTVHTHCNSRTYCRWFPKDFVTRLTHHLQELFQGSLAVHAFLEPLSPPVLLHHLCQRRYLAERWISSNSKPQDATGNWWHVPFTSFSPHCRFSYWFWYVVLAGMHRKILRFGDWHPNFQWQSHSKLPSKRMASWWLHVSPCWHAWESGRRISKNPASSLWGRHLQLVLPGRSGKAGRMSSKPFGPLGFEQPLQRHYTLASCWISCFLRHQNFCFPEG